MADEWLQRKNRPIDGPMNGSKAGAEPGLGQDGLSRSRARYG